LEYAYSKNFEAHGGTLLAKLLLKFAFYFSPAINSASLRSATLALAAEINFLGNPAYRFNVEYYSACAFKAIGKKNDDTLDESDLFAVFLLIQLSCMRRDLESYIIHLNGFLVVLRQLKRKWMSSGNRYDLWVFWGLARDLILESSRYPTPVETWNPQFEECEAAQRREVKEFCLTCKHTIGPLSFINRADYLTQLESNANGIEYAFSQAVWQYSYLLRACFRDGVMRQLTGKHGTDEETISLISELKADLTSAPAQKIISSIMKTFRNLRFNENRMEDLMAYSLLVHLFCQLLITLLDAETILDGATSVMAQSLGLVILDFMRREWLNQTDDRDHLFPRTKSRFLLPRVLWVSGLALTQEKFPTR
jgi:hypothetical protein